MIGKAIANCEIAGELGCGGMDIVHLGRDIGDARIELDEAIADPTASGEKNGRRAPLVLEGPGKPLRMYREAARR